jgi:hypothetical protein
MRENYPLWRRNNRRGWKRVRGGDRGGRNGSGPMVRVGNVPGFGGITTWRSPVSGDWLLALSKLTLVSRSADRQWLPAPGPKVELMRTRWRNLKTVAFASIRFQRT